MAILYSWDVKMTAILEKVISIIAPHYCISCGSENNVLCEACLNDAFIPLDSVCIFCQKPTVDWKLCVKCAKTKKLSSVWVAADYKGATAKLLKLYKFERLKAAYKPLARALNALLPYIGPNDVIIPLPTANSRVRQRGYDQSLLVAKELARIRGAEFATPLARAKPFRQVGADRKQRFEQADAAYTLVGDVNGKQVWLVDDICTTGASLAAAAKLLRQAGASSVNGAVVAWQRPKS